MAYDIYPAVDEGYNFPPQVRQSIAASTEVQATVENTMGEVVDDLVADAIANDATIKQAAIDAVEPVLLSTNVVRAYPEGPVQQTSKTEIPMWWTFKTLNDPYNDGYSDTYEGSWSGNLSVRGNVPILNDDNKLHPLHIPNDYVTKRMINELIPDSTNIRDVVGALGYAIESVINPDLPILAARVAKSRRQAVPVNGVFVGSSTSAASPGYIRKLTKKIQSSYIVDSQPQPQWSTSADFSIRDRDGFNLFSAAEGGTRSSNYLTRDECVKIAELDPAFIMHMVGANDFRYNVPIDTYTTGLLEKLSWFDELLTVPCQHIFVHPYQPMDNQNPVAPWSDYGDAAKLVFEARPDGVYRDISSAYIANKIPGSDLLTLISGDKIHQTVDGYEFMADLLTPIFIR